MVVKYFLILKLNFTKINILCFWCKYEILIYLIVLEKKTLQKNHDFFKIVKIIGKLIYLYLNFLLFTKSGFVGTSALLRC